MPHVAPLPSSLTVETMATRRVLDFYVALQRLDDATLRACYAPDAEYEDPSFRLEGIDRIAMMWEMLCDTTRRVDPDVWRLDWDDVRGTRHRCKALRRVRYRHPVTGRLVEHVVESRFQFNRDGKIERQLERYDLWSWSRQAYGASGWLYGWTPLMRARLRHGGHRALATYEEGRNGLVLEDDYAEPMVIGPAPV